MPNNISHQKYQRKLSASERYNLVINENYRYNVEAMVEGKLNGKFNLPQWQQAVAIAAQANPGARVRLKSFLGFCKWVDSGITPEVRIIKDCSWDGLSEKGAEFSKEAFKPLQGGPVFEVVLIESTPHTTAKIVMRALHAAMDARGLEFFSKDVFRVLRGESPIGSTATLTDLDIKQKFQDKVVVPPKNHEAIQAMPIEKIPEIGSSLDYIWRRVELKKCPTFILPKIAVFLAQQARSLAQGDVVFTIPVDLRGLREEVNSTANLSSFMRVAITEEDTAKTAMRKINQKIRDHLDCHIAPIIKILPWIPIRLLLSGLKKNINTLLYTPNKDLPTAGIVSLGAVDLGDYATDDFIPETIYGIPGSVGKLNIIVLNNKPRAQVIFSCPTAFNQQGQLDNLIQAFKQQMES